MSWVWVFIVYLFRFSSPQASNDLMARTNLSFIRMWCLSSEAVVSGFMPFSQHLADPVYLYFGRGFSSAPAATADSHYLVSVCLLDFSHFSLWCQWAWCPYTSERVLLSFPALISVFLPILGKELWVGSVFLQASWIFYIITSSYTQPLQIHHKVNYSLLCNVKAASSPSHSSANNEQSHVSLLS